MKREWDREPGGGSREEYDASERSSCDAETPLCGLGAGRAVPADPQLAQMKTEEGRYRKRRNEERRDEKREEILQVYS